MKLQLTFTGWRPLPYSTSALPAHQLNHENLLAAGFVRDRQSTTRVVSNEPIQEWLLPKIFTAAERFATANPKRIKAFIKDEDWVEDWAHFQCLIKEFGVYAWQDFPAPLRDRNQTALSKSKKIHKQEMHTHIAVQIFFFEQWNALKDAATEKRNYPRWGFANFCIEQWCGYLGQ